MLILLESDRQVLCYAAQQNHEKIQDYIHKIYGSFQSAPLFDTPSSTVSALLNEKYHIAKSKALDCRIQVDMIQSDSYLEISMKNSHAENIQEKNGEFISTKEDKNLLHGIGLKNVRKVVNTLNGHISISHTDEIFDVHILVPNY